MLKSNAPNATRYGWPRFLGDRSGGIIAALIALPYGLAMASLMGLPPVLGVFTSILTAPLIALLGRNPVLIGGTASATVPFVALAARNRGVAGAAELCILASLFMLLFWVLRLGRQVSRVPHAVVSGFSCGIGGMMLISQLDVIFGVASPFTRSAGSTLGQLAAVIDRLGDVRAVPLVLGLTVIVAATVSARLSPHAPAPLVGVVLAVLAARLFGLAEKEVGAVPSMLPAMVRFSWNPAEILSLAPSAFALAFVASVNILITSRVVEHFRGRHKRMHDSDADAELRAYGLANLCAGAFGAPLSVGIPARSLAVVRCGGTTPLANLLHAFFLLAILKVGCGIRSAHPDSRPGRRDGVDGDVPARLERLAALAQDDTRGRGRVSDDRRLGDLRECGPGGGDRLLDVCDARRLSPARPAAGSASPLAS